MKPGSVNVAEINNSIKNIILNKQKYLFLKILIRQTCLYQTFFC